AYDSYLNRTDAYEYDFGAGAAGPLIRRNHTDFLTSNNGANYDSDIAIHIRNLPVQQSVYDAGRFLRAQSAYEYDNYNQSGSDVFHASLINRSNISGLDGSSITTYYTRGNVTKTTRAVSFAS